MPYVHIRLVKQAIAADAEGKKARIAEAVAAAVARETGLPEKEVWIVFDEIEARDWYLGPDSVHRLRFAKA